MLRNPEIILECVSIVISGVSIDLSKHALDIGKSLMGKSNLKTVSQYLSRHLFPINNPTFCSITVVIELCIILNLEDLHVSDIKGMIMLGINIYLKPNLALHKTQSSLM